MPKPRPVWLVNDNREYTRHVFVYLAEDDTADVSCGRMPVLFPVFRCEKTGAERAYGCLREGLNKADLEALFGPLDEELRACDAPTRKAA